MNCKIDIQTPAGKSLEGFPLELECNESYNMNIKLDYEGFVQLDGAKFMSTPNPKLTPSDKIIIELLP